MKMYLYFFSSFFLIYLGIVFLLPLVFKTKEEYDVIKKYLFGSGLHVFGGILGCVLAMLLVVFPLDGTFLVGDLLPAVAILVLSVLLLLGYVRISKYLSKKMIEEGSTILDSLQIPAGIMGIVMGLLHVFFASVIFL